MNILNDKMTKSKKEISSNDKKILDAMVGNGRLSLTEISEKTGLSRQTVQKTINRLESEHVIWGYQVIVDEEKTGFSTYFMIIKRTIKPIDEKLADKVISRKLEETALKIGVDIVTSFYSHGSYDWILSIRAKNIIQVKKFTEQIKNMYSKHIADIHLLETLFFVKRQGILNPDIEKLKEFV